MGQVAGDYAANAYADTYAHAATAKCHHHMERKWRQRQPRHVDATSEYTTGRTGCFAHADKKQLHLYGLEHNPKQCR